MPRAANENTRARRSDAKPTQSARVEHCPAFPEADRMIADEVIYGARAIGAYFGRPAHWVYEMARTADLPLFRLSDSPRGKLAARKAALHAWLREREARSP